MSARSLPATATLVVLVCVTSLHADFTPLTALPAPAIVESAEDYPGGGFAVRHLVDGNPKTQYSSASKGTETFVVFDFGKPVAIGGFRHVDRNDPATVSASELVLLDEQGRTSATEKIVHANTPGGVTNHILSAPVMARRARWRVTGLGPSGFGTVGGGEVVFFGAGAAEARPTRVKLAAAFVPVLERKDGRLVRPIRCTVDYAYAEPVNAVLEVTGLEPRPIRLTFGSHPVAIDLPDVKSASASLRIGQELVMKEELKEQVGRPEIVYILPHSHVDIGYTELQTDVERKQMANIDKGIELARATADYPEGARYKWNVEVLWAVDSYLRQQPKDKQDAFIEAVRKGQVGLDAMYGNVLTGLCRPEELVRLFTYSTALSQRCGVPITSAMISDVPGYTWGVVSAMAQAGVKYWSIGPNYFDRMGSTIVTWENRPFWWVGPTGNEKVLCWVPHQGYAMSHLLRSRLTDAFMRDYLAHLQKIEYPHEVTYLRWSGHGDNAVPDETIPDFVKEWNARYAAPKMVIATTAEAFADFERRHGSELPTFKGDWTPYWEDGAGSSARETGMNRASAERLVQAETVWAMLEPTRFPAGAFHAAWRNVLLYSEHTWGAHNSITEPELDFVKNQWKIKQGFAVDADRQSCELLEAALARAGGLGSTVEVFNTTGWARTGLAIASPELSKAGDAVVGHDGQQVPSQRLSSGGLAFRVSEVPPFASRRYQITAGERAPAPAGVKASGSALENEQLRVVLDPASGAIVELRARGIDRNLADTRQVKLNEYLYLAGDDVSKVQRSGPAKITVKESGPLVGALLVESEAPGCSKLVREIRLVAGADHVEITNLIDKKRADVRGGRAGDWAYASREAKEGVHFAYAFNVPDGVMRMDIPLAVMRPEVDQIPGACKNWFTVQRWVDVSNDQDGVTWATLDAPLVQVGAITANLLGSQTSPDAWIKHLEPSQTLYSWVMNNHWHTNYRAYQEGPTVFRYALRPHRGFAAIDAARFGASLTQPLIVAAASERRDSGPRLVVEPDQVMITAFKPADQGQALIVRLFGASGADASARLEWSDPQPNSIWLSDASERPVREVRGAIAVPAWGVVTLRVEFAAR